ncbi:MAG: GNAT family N-acetyltransferase [Desertifilum sp. SIO1I2]|nr:GNAT family N-acetyltransferase [Desertifilum sp. SIO1I2]
MATVLAGVVLCGLAEYVSLPCSVGIRRKTARSPLFFSPLVSRRASRAPESQGRGIGSLLLQPVLERVDREGQTCCLYTSTERAVRFYQRQGFSVCEEVRFQTQAPPLWYMVRSPQ